MLAFIVALSMRPGEVDWARTIAFTTLVIAQLLFAFACRSEYRSPLQAGVFANPYLVIAVLCSFAMQLVVVYWPPMAVAFRTVPLAPADWMLVTVFASWSLIIAAMLGSVRARLRRRLSLVRVS